MSRSALFSGWRRAIGLGAAMLLTGTACPAEPQVITEARQALLEGVPQVAVTKLSGWLAFTEASADERSSASMLLAESLFAAGDHERALSVVQPLAAAGDGKAQLLRCNALTGAGRWKEALPAYRALVAAPEVALAARVGCAECLQALDRPEEAISELEALVRDGMANNTVLLRLAGLHLNVWRLSRARELSQKVTPSSPQEIKWKQYVEGRLLLAEDQAAPALLIFEEIIENRESLPESLLYAATFGATDARIRLRGYEQADRVLERFISQHADSAYLERAFERLDEIYGHEESAPESELHKWAQRPQARRAALAQFYVSKLQWRQRKWDKAAQSLDLFLRSRPMHPLAAQAHLMQADVHVAKGLVREAIQTLDAAMRLAPDLELRAEAELRSGLLHYQQGDYLLAVNLFDGAAEHSARLRQVATFNTALAWLHQKNFSRFEEAFRAFKQLGPDNGLASELLLEKGLALARAGDPAAEDALQLFLNSFPQHSRENEARLALAELSFVHGAPSTDRSQYLQAAQAGSSTEVAAHSEYLAIFMADRATPRNDDEVIRLCSAFVQQHPGSPLLQEVRMKLGQIYFHREDYANAETQFATLAAEQPGGPYAETALFLAGRAALRLINTDAVDRGFKYLDDVIRRDGPMKLYARQEQAIFQTRSGRESEAIALYDIILNVQPAAPLELRCAAFCGKGDNLLALARKAPGADDLKQALAVFEQLAMLPDVPATWRNQALYKKAKALEQMGRGPEALSAYYDALSKANADDREYFWCYKAGFDAARLLEQQEQWKAAIGVYGKLTALGGPRSAEAQVRLKQLRLEHFIWD